MTGDVKGEAPQGESGSRASALGEVLDVEPSPSSASRGVWTSLLSRGKGWGGGQRAHLPAIGWGALEVLVAVLVVLVVVFTRLLWLEPIEVGGDAITVWEFARNLAHGGELPSKFNHHTARFGLVLPSLAVQWIGGSSPTNYFLGPLLASVLLHLCVYLIGRKLSGPVAGTIAVVGLLTFEPMTRASSQILPEAFGPAYVSLSVFAALQFTDASTRWGARVWLLVSAVSLVFAYGSKMSYLYFAPMVALIVWWGRPVTTTCDPRASARGENESFGHYWGRRLQTFARNRGLLTPALLVLAMALMALIEWIFYASVTEGQAGGRLSVVTGSHSAKGAASGYQVREIGDFFALYTRAPDEWTFALGIGALALLGVSAFARDRRAKIFAGGTFIYFLLQTFVLRSFSPPTPWMEPHPRYLLALAAPISLLLGIFTNDACRAVIVGPSAIRRFWNPSVGRVLALLIALSTFLGLGADLQDDWESRWGRVDTWHKTERMGVELTQTFRLGVPIVSDTPKGKPAWAAAAVYIDPSALFIEGEFVQGKFVRRLDRGRYVAKALGSSSHKKKQLDNAVRRRLKQKRCVVHLQQRTRGFSGRTKTSDNCESLENELEEDPSVGKPLRALKKSSSDRRRR